MAKRLKTSVDVVEAIEKGERKPTLRQLKELSNAYKRPLASFLLSEPINDARAFARIDETPNVIVVNTKDTRASITWTQDSRTNDSVGK